MPRNSELPIPNPFLASLPENNVEALRPHLSAEDLKADPLRKQEMLEFVQAYWAIKDAAIRQCLLSLVKACATASDVTAEKPPACTDINPAGFSASSYDHRSSPDSN